MKSKQEQKNIAGLYLRLSHDDERAGESLSIENQRAILHRYAEENSFRIYDEYIDDGISGTSFNRPGVQRLLDDAKAGIIDTIVVKDLSRFGRNYIEVGQYLDYVFPAFGIRFIAIQDNVDTANRESGGMEMMPIMNVFNEWHAANTSKKIRAVFKANAKEGKYHASKAPYGYVKGTDDKKTPVIDEEVAPIVKRIFEMRSRGLSPHAIADVLNEEKIPTPSKYCSEKYGINRKKYEIGIWSFSCVNRILKNPTYLGNMVQQRLTTVSYKNHKQRVRDESEWVVVKNTHEAIITQELWDKVREVEKSVSRGKRTNHGYTHPLSGFLYCADCGGKMKLGDMRRGDWLWFRFNCGNHVRFGKSYCFSHHIAAKALEEIVIADIKDKAKTVTINEANIRKQFEERNLLMREEENKSARRSLQTKTARLTEIKRLIETAYEDRVKGKLPEEICLKFIEKYTEEESELKKEIAAIESKLNAAKEEKINADEFISNLKRYIDAPELTREMCLELIDKIVVGGHPNATGKPRNIDIVYKVNLLS